MNFTDVKSDDTLLDIGTGTGIVAQHASRKTAKSVIAVDFASEMAIAAHDTSEAAVLQADIHHLPLASGFFNVALGGFALNATDPHLAVAEMRRVLAHNGTIAIYEWGMVDAVSEYISDVVALYAVEEPPPALAKLRENQSQPVPWDNVETVDDLVAVFVETGFEIDKVEMIDETIVLPSLAAFLAYKFAWPSRLAEFEAMSGDVQQLCMAELRENLTEQLSSNGQFIWRPNIIRIRAVAS